MVEYDPIGTISSPYEADAPFQPVPDAGDFALELEPEFADGLDRLAAFTYAYVLFHLDRARDFSLSVRPPWRDGTEVGLFATRSPERPNPIGLSVVRIRAVGDARVEISPIDTFDGTPLLDVKPYVDGLDAKSDANVGWIDLDAAADQEHLSYHVKGIPH
ncbi:MAG: tRNA (N6-threonylcarbamoyladenosine(37)-N6)-methyltransferase TrmO [Halodesulfurarchaeum sp.]